MNILHLASHLNAGGVSRYVLSVSRELRARGHRVIIASGGGLWEAQATAAGMEHWALPLHTSVEFSPQVFAAGRRLLARLREHPVDVLHAHTRVGQVAAERVSRALHIPYVTTWHGFFRPNLGRRLWPCTGELTIAISEPVRDHLQRVFGVPPERIRLIAHGIDPAPFEVPADSASQASLRDRLRLKPNTPVIGTVARLVASKRVDQLVRSLPTVRAAAPDAQLLIIGDGEARASLERLAAELGLADAVRFAGAMPETRVALSLMDVFVFLPADQEGFGLSLLEAMAGGRPIVAVRRGGGASWVLEQSGVGTLVEPGDPKALGHAVLRYLQDGELACRSAGQARAVVRERYTLARMVDQVEAVYRELCERNAELGVRSAE